MQEKMRKKGELVSAVNGFNHTPPMDAVIALLDLYIELTRIQNDVAQESELKHNQGKIAAFRELKDVITRGNPQRPVWKIIDNGINFMIYGNRKHCEKDLKRDLTTFNHQPEEGKEGKEGKDNDEVKMSKQEAIELCKLLEGAKRIMQGKIAKA